MNKRFDFLGIQISATDLTKAIESIKTYPYRAPAYVSFPDASVIKEANEDETLKQILNNAWLCMPDGKPSQLVASLQGCKEVRTVSGFHLCKALLQTDLTHYFYGGSEQVLAKMEQELKANYPKARILGYKSPPFLQKQDIASSPVIEKDMEEIKALQPDIIWIGISSPKQDYLMHHFHQRFEKTLMLGVGGVFLYLADESLKSPEWMKKMGLRWVYRLLKEPKRLWPKYYETIKFLFRHRLFFLKLLMRRA